MRDKAQGQVTRRGGTCEQKGVPAAVSAPDGQGGGRQLRGWDGRSSKTNNLFRGLTMS